MDNTQLDESVLLIPDCHGLQFWRRAVEHSHAEKIIFLGDYVDPYEPTMDWYDVFLELSDIIQFKKSNKEKVTLLWGNHDLSYVYRFLRGSRYNFKAADSYLQLYMDSRDCFQMADEATISGKLYLFSHAGVKRQWLLANEKIFGKYEGISAETFNALENIDFFEALSNISLYRGGICDAGSMIWADCHEFQEPDSGIPGYIQIFGHTRQRDGMPWHNSAKDAYCIDCERAFILDSNGLSAL